MPGTPHFKIQITRSFWSIFVGLLLPRLLLLEANFDVTCPLRLPNNFQTHPKSDMWWQFWDLAKLNLAGNSNSDKCGPSNLLWAYFQKTDHMEFSISPYNHKISFFWGPRGVKVTTTAPVSISFCEGRCDGKWTFHECDVCTWQLPRKQPLLTSLG